MEFSWHPQKSIFFTFFGHFWRLPGVSPELLGCQIWRLFEHFGSIFWPVGDLMTSLHRLAHRRSCQNSSMGHEMCVTSYHIMPRAIKWRIMRSRICACHGSLSGPPSFQSAAPQMSWARILVRQMPQNVCCTHFSGHTLHFSGKICSLKAREAAASAWAAYAWCIHYSALVLY